MNTLSMESTTNHILAMLREGVEGPVAGPAYFSDHGPKVGLIPALNDVSAETVSVEQGGNSIAGHVHHLVFFFRASASWLRG